MQAQQSTTTTSTPTTTPIKILTYNTLIQKHSYTPSVKNDGGWRSYNWQSRRQQLILKIVSESSDIICLQQIRHKSQYNTPNYYDFYNPLSSMGFQGIFAKRNIGGQLGQQGLAIFYNKNNFYLLQSDILYFQDTTGRLALCLTLRSNQQYIFRVVTTHIVLPHPTIELSQRQIQLLAQWNIIRSPQFPTILTGDFNLDMEVPIHYNIMKILQQKYIDTHMFKKCIKPTFSLNLIGANTSGMISQLMGTKIDYIFVTKDDVLVQNAQINGRLQDLPTMGQPSDHLPISAVVQIKRNCNSIIEDIIKMKQLFIQVRQRDYYSSPKYKQFLDIFWLLPRTIKNQIYSLTYIKAVKMGLYQQNYQFGKIAFTNNTYRIQAILDQNGNNKNIKYQVVKRDIIPMEVILEILDIIQERIVIIPELIKDIERGGEGDGLNIEEFVQKFDQKLNRETCNLIYGEVYKIASEKYLPTNHFDFGRVSFRKMDGWDISNSIRIKAMQKYKLP